MMLAAIAFAMGEKAGGGSSGLVGLIPLILMFVIFYFILIRPQQRQVKKHQEFIKNLSKGDRVVTSGGLHGTITGMTENIVTLEISDNVRVKITRAAIQGLSKDQSSSQQQQ